MTAIEEEKYLSLSTLEELTGSLLSHEVWFNQEEELLTNAFITQASLNRGRGRGGWGRGRRGWGSPHTEEKTNHEHLEHSEHSHISQVHRGRGKRWTNKSNILCNYCKKYGHYERECGKKQVDKNSGRANVSKEEEYSSEVMFLSYQVTEEHCNSDLWLLDNSCSNHMTGNK